MVPTLRCGLVRANFSLDTGGLFIISLSVERNLRKPFVINSGAHNRNRTDDLFLTKEVLYRLSYMGKSSLKRQVSRCLHYHHHTAQSCRVPLATLLLERVMGIEPTSSAWKAEVLPLNYTRLDYAGC